MTESSRARGGLPLAIAILVAGGAMSGLLAGLPSAGGSAATYPDAAEIPTDGRRVEALGPAPLGALGAEVFAISNDGPQDARRMATELGLVIYRYRMKGERMPMADMGYVLIDATGRIHQHKIDRQFGEHVGDLVKSLGNLAQGRGPA